MNPTQAPEVNEVAEMYGPTSAEEAASQSNPTQTTQVISDLIKSHVPRIAFEEGDNWLRFINPYRKPWYIAVGFYKMHTGDKVARVIHQEHFGQPNLFRLVQIQLYQNPETKPFMWTQDNPEGFRFDEQRRAFLVAARFENTLSPFGITQVTLGRTPRKGKPYRPSWGDALINLPTEKTIDPSNPAANGTLRWGSIFDPVKGRLVKCTLNNAGTINVTATFTPADRAMPLGQWEQREGAKCAFVPVPQYAEQLRNAPNLEESLVKLTADQQVDLIRTFLPAELWQHAERIITTALHGGARRSRTIATNAKPMTEVTQPSAGSTPAPTTQLPVPAEEPAEIAQPDQIYVAFVAKLGPKFRDIGEEIIRKLITRSLVTAGNMDTMANLPSDVLKSIAVAG